MPRRQPPPPERSPEERARAAAERAARRGDAAPPPETVHARRGTPPGEPFEEPDVVAAEPVAIRAEDLRAAAEPRPRDPDATAEWPAPQSDGGSWFEEPEPPAPAPPERPALQARAKQPPQRSSNGRRPPARRGRAGRRALALAALLLIGGALYLINATFQPFHADPHGAVSVKIPSGADAGEIGKLLEAAGVIESARLFEANATVTLRRAKLRPGNYRLPRGMSNGRAIEALMQGPEAKVVPTFKLTIPEGRSRRENVPLISKSEVRGDYAKASADLRMLRRARRLGAPRSARTLEGFLFPATYTLISEASARDLVGRQLDAFAANIGKVNMATARRRNLTRYDVLIIASMVEREAQLAKERPLIAAVIYNRLKQGVPLGIDATIRYDINDWSRPLRQSDLERDTPYNTRTRRGLTPTPIGNPGLSSIKAAAKPAKVSYLFFVRKPGKTGEHAFSSTDRQFQRDVARYQASRGGP